MAYHRDPTPAEDYSVLSGRASVSKGSRRLKSIPAEDYHVLSGDTRNKQDKRHKELQRPVGTWSQNQRAAGACGQRSNPSRKMQVIKTSHRHGISPLARPIKQCNTQEKSLSCNKETTMQASKFLTSELNWH